MYNNYTGRLRHIVGFYVTDNTPDEWGQPSGDTLVFETRCNVQVKRGDQLSQAGTEVTRQFVTVLMRYDIRVTYDQWIEWKGRKYEIQHITPDDRQRDMIVTAEWMGK